MPERSEERKPLARDQKFVRGVFHGLKARLLGGQSINKPMIPEVQPLSVEPAQITPVRREAPLNFKAGITATSSSDGHTTTKIINIELEAPRLDPDEVEYLATIASKLFAPDDDKKRAQSDDLLKRVERIERRDQEREIIERIEAAGIVKTDPEFGAHIVNAERVPGLKGAELREYLRRLNPLEGSQGI